MIILKFCLKIFKKPVFSTIKPYKNHIHIFTQCRRHIQYCPEPKVVLRVSSIHQKNVPEIGLHTFICIKFQIYTICNIQHIKEDII